MLSDDLLHPMAKVEVKVMSPIYLSDRMPAYRAHHLIELLKKEVLTAANLPSILPAHCKTIALKLQHHVNAQVSETTIKRLYGFALSRYQTSYYTLDALSKFCGYSDWDDFSCSKTEVSSTLKTKQDDFLKKLQRITAHTLHTLKSRCGIPYRYTVKRKYLDKHLQFFFESDAVGTILSAPMGFGKTIALCRWVDHEISDICSPNVILFFSLSTLSNVLLSEREAHNWLTAILGFDEEIHIEEHLSCLEQQKRRLLVVIDAVDEINLPLFQYRSILNQISNIVSAYAGKKSLKLIISMRDSSLLNGHNFLDYDSEHWFKGFSQGPSDFANFPLLHITEVADICKNINPSFDEATLPEFISQLNHPLHLQFLYKKEKEKLQLRFIDRYFIYAYTSTFISQKIYQCFNSLDKIVLINAICERINYEKYILETSKRDFDNLIKHHKQAYQELLNCGFLVERNLSSPMEYKLLTTFASDDFLAHSIANYFIKKNGDLVNGRLFSILIYKIQDVKLRVKVFKWILVYAITHEQVLSFDLLDAAQLTAAESFDAVLFICDIFDKECKEDSKSAYVAEQFNRSAANPLINYFIKKEYFCKEYTIALKILLNFNLSISNKSLINLTLAMNAVVLLDLQDVEYRISLLKAIPYSALNGFQINPATCLETIFYFLNFGILKRDAFKMLTQFYFQCSIPTKRDVAPCGHLLYLLGMYTQLICGNPVKSIRAINTFNKLIDGNNRIDEGYSFFSAIATVDAYLQFDTDKAMCVYNNITAQYNERYIEWTPLMYISYQVLKLKMLIIATNDYDAIANQALMLYKQLAESEFKLVSLCGFSLMLMNKQKIGLGTDFDKMVYYTHTKFSRENGINDNNQMIELESYNLQID